MSCYFADAQRLPRLEEKDAEYPTPDYHRDPRTNELTLGYRGYLSSVGANMTNFYNEDDWALATGHSFVGGAISVETNWEKNQIDYKPDGGVTGAVHNGIWSYHYDPTFPSTYPLDQRAWLDSTLSRYVSDSWEMKAFLARSRTKAVGSFRDGGPFSKENLGDTYGFANVRDDHSGQFTRTIQQVSTLYGKIRTKLEE